MIECTHHNETINRSRSFVLELQVCGVRRLSSTPIGLHCVELPGALRRQLGLALVENSVRRQM